MTALQVRLVAILRNMGAPVTAADIRARCQIPQDLDLIARDLRALCRTGKAIEVSPARFAHRDYQQRPEDKQQDRLQPVPSVERDAEQDAEPVVETALPKRRISKTEHVLQVLQRHATSLSAAMSAEQISNALGGEMSPNNVSALLCAKRQPGNTRQLVSTKDGYGKLWWAWCWDAAPPTEEQKAETPQQEPDMANNNAALARELGGDIPELQRPEACIDDELAVMSALEEMASRLDTHVRDRDLKVAVLGKLAAMSLPTVAALLQRIIDEDLVASEA